MYIFTPNTLIRSSEVNANFSEMVIFVPLIPAVEVLNIDPTNVTWNELDLTAVTDPNAIMVVGNCHITSSGTARNLYMRSKGDTTTTGSYNHKCRGVINLQTSSAFTCAVDSNQILEWYVSGIDTTNVTIGITGYWKRAV